MGNDFWWKPSATAVLRSGWGRGTFALTLDVYGDYIPGDGVALRTLPEPPAVAKPAEAASNVLRLFARQAD